jgi:four helix bundle protein
MQPLDVYRRSKRFPREEIYGLASQMRRASASIGANIAEGSCRRGDAEFGRFLQMAAGSASELEYYILLARDPQILENADYERLSSAPKR